MSHASFLALMLGPPTCFLHSRELLHSLSRVASQSFSRLDASHLAFLFLSGVAEGDGETLRKSVGCRRKRKLMKIIPSVVS